MKGLEALAERMGVSPNEDTLYTSTYLPPEKYLTFDNDVHGVEYGFCACPQDPSIIECFYAHREQLGQTVVSEVQVVTNNSAGIRLAGAKAAIIYRPTSDKHATGKLFMGGQLVQAYADMPDEYAGYEPAPIVFANGLIVARKFSAKGLQWHAEDRARQVST